jgi:DNA-binding transcriptional LysR family regulator
MEQSVASIATIDLNAVSVFVRVVETGSFTLAARELGMPKSAVSRRVARLEQALGVRLLQRTTRRVTLTDAGTNYHRQAARALTTLSEASAAVSLEQEEPRGLVRLTAPADLTPELFGAWIAEFCARYPLVQVELDLTQRRVDLIAEGYDFALRAGVLADSSFIARKIVSSSLVLAASPGYLEKRGTPRRPSDLEGHACLMFRAQNGRSRWTLTGPKGEVSVDVTGPVIVNAPAFAAVLARAGAGIGLVPDHEIGKDLADGRLVSVLPGYSIAGGGLYLVYPAARHVPQRVVLLREFLFERIRAALGA